MKKLQYFKYTYIGWLSFARDGNLMCQMVIQRFDTYLAWIDRVCWARWQIVVSDGYPTVRRLPV